MDGRQGTRTKSEALAVSRAVLSAWGAVSTHHELATGLLYLSQLVAQATGVGRPDYWQLGCSPVGPVGGRRLGVEVEDGGIVAGCAGGDGQMQGQRLRYQDLVGK